MAKLDTTTIQGYAEMTPEQKLVALEAMELPDPDYSGYVKKDVFDKTAADLAAWKKKHNDLLSEEDRKKQEDAEQLANLRKELDDLRKDKTVSEYKAMYIAQGYTEELADATAKALAEGNTGEVFANQKKFIDEYTKKVMADALKGTPRPPVGGAGTDGVDYAKKIEEAQAAGNMVALAYYTRLQAEQKAATK